MMDDEIAFDGEKLDEVMLPGFRFHPTDEELVGFYLKRKIQQRPLAIELIKQLDIYKYDPWDLPKLASSTGEKEWYFYCPRDRKYRNSARPNRVTGAGFWKATGTDRPIYSSEGTKCIGLKKSLVFYRGRAAKGVKTEWMMHEFRLPSMVDPTAPNRFTEKNIPAHDSWAICRIFKKTNTNFHQRTNYSHQYHQTNLYPVSPDQTNTSSESPNSITSATSLAPQAVIPSYQNYNVSFSRIPTNVMQLESSPPIDIYPGLEFATSYKTLSSTTYMSGPINNDLEDLLFPHLQTSETTNESSMMDLSSVFRNMTCPDHGCIGSVCEGLGSVIGSYQEHSHHHQHYNNIDDLLQVHESDSMISSLMKGLDHDEHGDDRYLGLMSSYGLGNMNGGDAWRSNLVGWDTTSELSTLFSTTTTTTCHI